MMIIRKTPSNCSAREIDEFLSMVQKGGEVTLNGLRARVEAAEHLVFLYEEGDTLAGVAALKRPGDNYKRKVFRKAGASEDPANYFFEAGWIFVDEPFRQKGYSRELLKAVLDLAGTSPVYATTKEEKEFMRRTNQRCGLMECGNPFTSDEGEYKLVLYTWRKE